MIKSRGLLAGVLLALVLASPAAAQLTVRDAAGATQSLCEVTGPSGWLYPCHVMTGVYSGAPKYIQAENDGSLDVTVKGTAGLTLAQLTGAGLALHSDMTTLATNTSGLATHTDLTALLSLLGSPLQAGGKVDTIIPGTGVDRGGTIASGGVAQSLMALNSNRRGWSLQNQSSGLLYVNCSATATQDYHSLQIQPGQLYETPNSSVGTGACSIIGPATGQAFFAREF